ncbi:MAG: acetyl esterase [Maledivibacter sp.]|nr:acetyl esterase [Maledivibacter sp.]
MQKNKLNVFSRMTKQMKEVLRIQDERAKDAFVTGDDFDELREAYVIERKYWNEGGPSVENIRNMTINGPHGDIPIRIYYPNKKSINSCCVFIHGGGFVVGNMDTHDRIMRTLSNYADVAVIGIDYRLSPENKFPVALEECVALVEYLHNYGENHGIDGNNISLAGDSGGASLSLATTLFLRNKKEDISYITSLILYYGGFGLKDSMSMRLFGGPWDGLTRKDINYYCNCYVKNEGDKDNPYLDCLSADLTYGIPSTYICVGDLDPLLDDSLALEKILTENGIKCKCDVYKGLLHSFLHYSKILEEAKDALKKGAEFMKENKQ